MVDIPMRSSAPVTRQTVLSINERKVEGAKTTRTITSINHTSSQAVSNASTPASKPLPPLVHMVQKGQKTPLENSGKLTSIKACLGWNVKTVFHADSGADREIISVDFTRLDPSVARIVFVLTINEAFEKNLNFGMLEDAYIRIMDPAGTELVSFKMDEYYTNVTSMMIGELYLHNGAWKFNAIGNGVAKDLAGLCGLYGVQVI